MTLPRAVGLILILATIASAAVWFRVQRAHMAYQNHLLARQEIELIRAIDQAKSKIARLRAPKRIRERVGKMQLSALPPESRSADFPGDRLVQGGR
jgi:hypothetical protein